MCACRLSLFPVAPKTNGPPAVCGQAALPGMTGGPPWAGRVLMGRLAVSARDATILASP